jgi:hypothetical protein
MLRRWIQALILAALVLLGGVIAPPARSEWNPPQHHCIGNEWRTHKNGHCGWRTVHRLIRLVFSTGEAKALCIAKHESGYRITATNGQYRGIYQFGYNWWHDRFNPYDPRASALRALSASHGTDFHWWTTARYC